MKRSTMNLMLAAAVTMVASTVGSAQTLKAEIPFTFRAAGVVMAPGTYMVTGTDGESRFQLRDAHSRKSVILVPAYGQDAPAAWRKAGHPALAFSCREGACSLKTIYTNSGAPAHAFAVPGSQRGEPAGLAMIRLVAAGAK